MKPILAPESEPDKKSSKLLGGVDGDPEHGLTTNEVDGRSSWLSRVRQLAKKDKSVRFTQLFQYMRPLRLLYHFDQLNKGAAPGVDDVCWADYKENLKDNISKLNDRLHCGSYRALPAKRVYIPKGKDSKRPLGIVAVEDKVVQHAVVAILEAIYEQDFLGFSYGFRPGRSQHDALDALSVAIVRKKVNWVLDADISGFFDSINHDKLMALLGKRIGDPRLLRLIEKWLKAGVLEDNQWKSTEEGTPQGGVVSPILSNVFLHYVFDEWALNWRTKHANGDMVMVRYADDFVVGFQHRSDAVSFLKLLEQRMEEFGLKLHPEKTRLIEFGRSAARNRKARRQGKPETFDFLGFTHICGVTRNGYFKLWRKTIAKRLRNKLSSIKVELRRRINHPLEDVAKWLKSVVIGYYNYHAIPGNLGVLATFQYNVGRAWHKVIRRRGQRGKMTWRHFIERWWCRIPTPKAKHPYPEKRFDAKTLERSPVR
jgi:group II intron reverse transcriptase/maturase